jgi:hypothetical protein
MIHRHQPDRGRYPESLYDDDYCLKPPTLLWVALVYLSRGALLPLLAGLGHYANVSADAMAVMRSFWRPDLLLPGLFAVPVLFSLMRRSPRASQPVRSIWRNGRALLAVAAASDIVLSLYSLKSHGDLDGEAFVTLGACAVDAYFLLYVVLARRIRDTFADFPPRHSD